MTCASAAATCKDNCAEWKRVAMTKKQREGVQEKHCRRSVVQAVALSQWCGLISTSCRKFSYLCTKLTLALTHTYTHIFFISMPQHFRWVLLKLQRTTCRMSNNGCCYNRLSGESVEIFLEFVSITAFLPPTKCARFLFASLVLLCVVCAQHNNRAEIFKHFSCCHS